MPAYFGLMTPALSERLLRVLHVEDAELDHQLIQAQLCRAGLHLEMQRVDSLVEVTQALQSPWDAIISDYNLPGFSGLVVLDMLKDAGLLIPFILVSGEIGEDTAVAAMRTGASDYLLKNNLARLAPALMHAIEANESQRARAAADEELRKSKQRLHELAGHLQTSVEMERAAIAREIHDDVGGSLTALNFDLAWIARHATDAAVKQRAQSALETVTHAIEASQRVMHNLRPAILEQGLVAAVQWMAARFERRTGVVTELSDNGRGMEAGALAKARSFGIRGLHERAATVGGWVDLSSNSKGVSLILSVPLRAEGMDFLGNDEPAVGHDPSAWGAL